MYRVKGLGFRGFIIEFRALGLQDFFVVYGSVSQCFSNRGLLGRFTGFVVQAGGLKVM